MFLDEIVPRFGFYVHENEWMGMSWICPICYDVKYIIWWSMNVHSVLECWDERIAHIGTHIDLCIDIWTCVPLCVMWNVAHIYVYTHTYEDLVNRGALNGVLMCNLN